MRETQLDTRGCLNLVGGFWRQVRQDLHPQVDTPRTQLLLKETRRWIHRRSPHAPPGSFEWWCRFGGTNLDPDTWRQVLQSGHVIPPDGILPRAD